MGRTTYYSGFMVTVLRGAVQELILKCALGRVVKE